MISVKDLTKKYGSFVAVDHISFDIPEGQIVGLLGPNGAGKSTTMNMITGFIEPTEGEITVDGISMAKKPKQAKKNIGYMPENVPLYTDLTVKEFIRYMAELKLVPKKERKTRVNEVMAQVGVADVQNKLIRNLSRGYKQRVSLAGALVSNPKVLILDEPTVGLDPKQITEIRSLIKSLGQNHTIIISSHILSEISQICQKVIIIHHGKLIAQDTPEHLEKKVEQKNSIMITVEDPMNKMQTISTWLPEAKEVALTKEQEDGTKEYLITSPENIDIRKILFDRLPKEQITIFELKKPESTLEDAFMKLISTIDSQEEQKEEKAKEEKVDISSKDKTSNEKKEKKRTQKKERR